MHERIIRVHSDFFLGCLRRGWRETEEATVRFPEDDPELFRIFADFVYSGQLDTVRHDDRDDGFDDEWKRLGLCWALGEKLLSISFKDAVMDAIVDKIITRRTYPIDLHHTAYSNSSGGNKMRELLVDVAVWCWKKEDFKDQREKAEGSEFFCDVSMRFCEMKGRVKKATRPWIDAGCQYHEHEGSEQCYKDMFPGFNGK